MHAPKQLHAPAGLADDPTAYWEVAPEIAGLNLSIVNVYFIGAPSAADRGWCLVDAGLSFTGSQIRRAAEHRFGCGSRPAAIILTHGHFDHVGGLPMLADLWDCPIYCHPLELPYLTGRSSYPPSDASVSGAMAFLSRFYPRGPYDFSQRIAPLPADGSVPGLADWRWIATPGHSPGHVALFRNRDRVLIAGDAFVTVAQESAVAVLTQRTELRRPPAYFTPDWNSARNSVAALAALEPLVAATGHGRPMAGEQLRDGLTALIDNWDTVAVPRGGRYSQHPAITNEDGFVCAPPPVPDYRVAALLGFTAGMLAQALVSKQSS
jgi:glyoxylase-like metal-dependent hydrolase (beta-lactamase superfamily II)